MGLSTERHIRNLPKRLPVGTVYVVEGRGGHRGNLCVSSRYVVMPGGQKVEIPADLSRTQPAQAGLRRPFGVHGHTSSRAKRFLAPPKKIGAVAGTRSHKGR